MPDDATSSDKSVSLGSEDTSDSDSDSDDSFDSDVTFIEDNPPPLIEIIHIYSFSDADEDSESEDTCDSDVQFIEENPPLPHKRDIIRICSSSDYDEYIWEEWCDI